MCIRDSFVYCIVKRCYINTLPFLSFFSFTTRIAPPPSPPCSKWHQRAFITVTTIGGQCCHSPSSEVPRKFQDCTVLKILNSWKRPWKVPSVSSFSVKNANVQPNWREIKRDVMFLHPRRCEKVKKLMNNSHRKVAKHNWQLLHQLEHLSINECLVTVYGV